MFKSADNQNSTLQKKVLISKESDIKKGLPQQADLFKQE